MPLILIVWIFTVVAGSHDTMPSILVYHGPGVSPHCLQQTVDCLLEHLAPNHEIQLATAADLSKAEWAFSTRLLVMPGGQDTPYVDCLEPEITQIIRQFVHSGGIYLGLCAGAYFASKRVEFELDRSDYRVVGNRQLALVDATAKGAAFPGFVYGTELGARAAPINLASSNKEVRFYFNGGPYIDLHEKQNVEILGRYADGRPAIVKSQFGDGFALLSGVHFEFNPDTMVSTSEIVEQLHAWNQDRIVFLSDLRRLMKL